MRLYGLMAVFLSVYSFRIFGSSEHHSAMKPEVRNELKFMHHYSVCINLHKIICEIFNKTEEDLSLSENNYAKHAHALLFTMHAFNEVSMRAAQHAACIAAEDATALVASKYSEKRAANATWSAFESSAWYAAHKALASAIYDILSGFSGDLLTDDESNEELNSNNVCELCRNEACIPFLHNACEKACHNAYIAFFNQTFDTAYDNAYEKDCTTLKNYLDRNEKINCQHFANLSWQTSENAVLNASQDNMRQYIGFVYQSAWDSINDSDLSSHQNIFISPESWKEFRKKYFNDLPSDSLLFVKPWLNHLDQIMMKKEGENDMIVVDL